MADKDTEASKDTLKQPDPIELASQKAEQDHQGPASPDQQKKAPRFSKRKVIAAAAIVVVLLAGGGCWWHYEHRPAKIDAATKTQLEQAAKDLKSVNLAGVKSSVGSVSNVESGFNKQQ
jgi:hypothetical protein